MKRRFSVLMIAVLSLFVSLTQAAPAAAYNCSGGVKLKFVAFEVFGMVHFEIENTLPLDVTITDFHINWVQRLAGVITLARVSVNAPPTQPGVFLLWTSNSTVQDRTPPTIGSQEGVWFQDYVLSAHSVTPFFADMDGFAGLFSDLGGTPADFNGTSLTISGANCDSDVSVEVGDDPALSDGRLNPGFGDLTAVIYPWDGAGNPAIHIYGVNENSQGYILLALSEADLADLPKNPPENLLIAQIDNPPVAVYLLTTGEYQINIGPDAGGEVSEIIFTGLPPVNLQQHSYNINDILYPDG